MNPKLLLVLLVICIAGCSSGDPNNVTTENASALTTQGDNSTPVLTPENLLVPDNSAAIQYSVLFMGNSHVSALAEPMAILFESGAPQKDIGILKVSTGGFLAERLDDGRSIDTLKSEVWSHVIFQAQKYSQSGQFDYPTVATQTWIQMAKSQNATPILFPEHPQRGNSQEGQKVRDLHVSIANIQSSSVAPVGLVWDRVINLLPNLELHQADGNHASDTGNFLSALVFYQTISGNSADLILFISSINIDAATQDLFGQITSEVIAEHPPCEY
ncbi:MAG: hypothetical protein ACI808_003355 [Paraglaciecola sp.]|jgi:hypothetical protein